MALAPYLAARPALIFRKTPELLAAYRREEKRKYDSELPEFYKLLEAVQNNATLLKHHAANP
jgi:hypothetical protein